MNRMISLGTIIVAVIASVLCTGFVMQKAQISKPVVETKEEQNIVVLEKTLKSAGDLVTQKYIYTDAFSDEQSKKLLVDLPFTTKRVAFTYRGTIYAGYDLTEVEPYIDEENKQIIVPLPEFKIVANEVDPDSYEYIIQEDSIFNQYKPEDMTGFQKVLKKKMQETAENDKEFAEAAEGNAKKIITSLLEATGQTEGYEIVFE